MINGIVDHLDVAHLDRTFAALADPSRRLVVDLLRDGPVRASGLAELAGVSRAAMSRHLRVLRASGLVEADTPEADARERVYRLRADEFVSLQAWLDQVQVFWAEQLGSFKLHAERTRRDGA
jgi:DNA-binding transcriptional ArsR family regulator